jgi:hypothetical protein
VVGATGAVQPCFFISGPTEPRSQAGVTDLAVTLNGDRMIALRGSIRAGARAECQTCVCSMWRDTNDLAGSIL